MRRKQTVYAAAVLLGSLALACGAEGIADAVGGLGAAPAPSAAVEIVAAAPEPTPEDSAEELWSEDGRCDLPVVPLGADLGAALVESCEEYGVPLEIALGVMEVESAFQADVVNPASGCYGLMQLHPAFFPSGLSPAENIRAGVAYLGELINTYDGWEATLTAYHDGVDTGDRRYADKVLGAAGEYACGVTWGGGT